MKTEEKVIEKAYELIQPINYEPFYVGYYVLINQNDSGGPDHCINCIKKAVKEARKAHFEQRQKIKDEFGKLINKGIWQGKKVKEKYTKADINKEMKRRLKQYPAKASFTFTGHDPDFGGGLHEPCTCENCGEPFSCSFTPDLDEANRLLEYLKRGYITEKEKWEIDIALYHFEYTDDEVKPVLIQVANRVIELFKNPG